MNNKLLSIVLLILFTFTNGIAADGPPERDSLPNHPTVLAAFDHFYGELEKVQGVTENVLQAVVFAAEKHQDQVRKNVEKTPYIVHPLRVATYLLTVGKVTTKEVLIAAVLHDTVEDTDATFEEIAALFGSEVASLVQEVTNDPTVPSHVQKEQQVLNAPYKSAAAAMIKLADKWDNLSDLATTPPEGWEEVRIDQYFRHAQAVIDNLPPVNAALKSSVESVISKHWKSRR